MQSFTEENYLKTIYYIATRQAGEVSTNALAEMTATKAASVTDMLRKLADKQLIHYKKYQGVRLTEEGERLALQVIRRHRLWEVFLVEKLGFGWDAVHEIAEELEHVRSEELVTRLDTFLGSPQFDPHGDPIPTQTGDMPQTGYRKLSEAISGDTVRLMAVLEHSTEFLQHLDHSNLTLGCTVAVTEVNSFDKSMLVAVGNGRTVFISHDVARNLLVS
ncbi:metal-dependent transcriptional regulator [Spirosoma utsteinense]|uniref:Transcriptional regulator MntR n=1 Tax=Spirosoma utsteinense TaxID=2585773 RepID=A0ABR6W973_9BACT|nr:metal-dependent transcriptional regulator [Spirosoma utsteinense]MBC3784112.1 DtxR family Mn-dependent transcriptional regulator [Spirosoma utsteinense]MBC3792799.1 DtxR family Mn-dependent transcriptional regulator [Spirosoma utsteinense]